MLIQLHHKDFNVLCEVIGYLKFYKMRLH